MTLNLPSWLKALPGGAFEIDPNIAYPAVFKALGVFDKEIDQYAIEVAYQCSKLAAQDIISDSGEDPREKEGGNGVLALIINSDGDRKTKWALANYPAGRGVERATKGKEAANIYQQMKVRRALAAA